MVSWLVAPGPDLGLGWNARHSRYASASRVLLQPLVVRKENLGPQVLERLFGISLEDDTPRRSFRLSCSISIKSISPIKQSKQSKAKQSKAIQSINPIKPIDLHFR